MHSNKFCKFPEKQNDTFIFKKSGANSVRYLAQTLLASQKKKFLKKKAI